MADCIVSGYHNHGDLMEFLDSWDKFGHGKLWVADVDPLPGEDNIGKYEDYDDITYLPIDYNCGYAKAINLGASFGNNEVVVAFNADCVLTEGVIEDCEFALMCNDSWGVLGPMQVNKQGKVTHGGIFGTNQNVQFRGWQQPDREEFHDVKEAVTVSGSAYFVKREVWDKVTDLVRVYYPDVLGAMLPTPLYYEETCVSYMARYLGYKVMYYGKAQMIHKWDQTPGGSEKHAKATVARQMFREILDAYGIAHD